MVSPLVLGVAIGRSEVTDGNEGSDGDDDRHTRRAKSI
jgi:hypothetical protein